MEHEFPFGTTGLLAFSDVPLLPEPFCKWKATQTSVDSRAAGTCLFLPSFVLHFEKERETEIAASAFRNFIWRHFLNVCHTFDISR